VYAHGDVAAEGSLLRSKATADQPVALNQLLHCWLDLAQKVFRAIGIDAHSQKIKKRML
jgi:hypothetical protein